MANIFLSYARKSEASAQRLVGAFRDLGHDVWFDRDLSGGQKFWETILSRIQGCDIFVFVLDPPGLASNACTSERHYANDLGKPILPVLVSGELPRPLPVDLSGIHIEDYRRQDNEAALRLAKALNRIPPAPALPDPLPKPPAMPEPILDILAREVDAAPPLSFETQSALLTKLKIWFQDEEVHSGIADLLGRFRKRPDILPAIAKEIDMLLTGGPFVPLKERISGALVMGLIGALAGALGLAIFLWRDHSLPGFFQYIWKFPTLCFVIGGIVAGIISGLRPRVMAVALIGMGVSTGIEILFFHPGHIMVKISALFVSPLGAMVGSLILKGKNVKLAKTSASAFHKWDIFVVF